MFVSVNFLKIREVPVFRILKASLKQVPNQVGSYREMNSRDEKMLRRVFTILTHRGSNGGHDYDRALLGS